MQPRIWYNTLPFITSTYFTLSIITFLGLWYRPDFLIYFDLNWEKIVNGWEIWRLVTHYLIWGGPMLSLYHIALVGHYFRCMELQYHASHRGAFEFLLLLIWCHGLILFTSYFTWPDLRFGGPILLFYVLTLYAWNDPDVINSFFGIPLSRKWLVLAHWILLVCTGTNFRLSLVGIVFGYGTARLTDFLSDKTGLRVHPTLMKWGEKLALGEPLKEWQVDRRGGPRLGGAETTRWSANAQHQE